MTWYLQIRAKIDLFIISLQEEPFHIISCGKEILTVLKDLYHNQEKFGRRFSLRNFGAKIDIENRAFPNGGIHLDIAAFFGDDFTG